MSVLECDRVGCDNIMCSRFSSGLNMYICSECFDEIVSKQILPSQIEAFMKEEKKRIPDFSTFDIMDKIFPRREE
jgi:hypothetical protein